MKELITKIRSSVLVLEAENIDTDQIIPARFLTTIGREGLGAHAFADWRLANDGTPRPECALADPRAERCSILVAGDNFGCGSSREHAAWAIYDLGIRAVLSTRIADIFGQNAVKNGIVPITIDAQTLGELLAAPWSEVAIDLEQQTVELASGRVVEFEIDAFAKHCLTSGIDELGFLLQHDDEIVRFEAKLDG